MLHLVLDLDETLVWAKNLTESIARPHLRQFLDFCFQRFASVSIWTAASQEWWELNRALHFSRDPFALVLTGEQCAWRWDYESAFHRDPLYVAYKPLKKIWRRKSSGMTAHNTVIVDDDPQNAVKNYGNALTIPAFYGNPEDVELINLQNRLEHLLQEFKQKGSVRQIQLCKL